jgi:hypothetical protein
MTEPQAWRNLRSNSEYAIYRALYDYTPEPEDQADGYLVICCNDLFMVKRPFTPETGTEQKPGGWCLEFFIWHCLKFLNFDLTVCKVSELNDVTVH